MAPRVSRGRRQLSASPATSAVPSPATTPPRGTSLVCGDQQEEPQRPAAICSPIKRRQRSEQSRLATVPDEDVWDLSDEEIIR